jgi:hypothetical protein
VCVCEEKTAYTANECDKIRGLIMIHHVVNILAIGLYNEVDVLLTFHHGTLMNRGARWRSG